MDQVKEAFSKVKEDIDSIRYEIDSLKLTLAGISRGLSDLAEIFKDFKEEQEKENQKKIQNNWSFQRNPLTPQQTNRQINSTTPTHASTHNYHYRPLKTQNMGISTGNQGVPTDKQTNRQTNQQTQKLDKSSYNQENSSIDNAVQILESLDNIKKEIRLKFKRLTDQELLVFSTLYQLDEENGFTDYKTISEKINLSESSIRDYIGRLIKKGIPVDKTKLNNKTIQLNVSKNLKKIASLNTILQLREL
jgi:DNA-binding MarR family transcriptional regulator